MSPYKQQIERHLCARLRSSQNCGHYRSEFGRIHLRNELSQQYATQWSNSQAVTISEFHLYLNATTDGR